MPNYHIRTMTSDDLPEVSRVDREAFSVAAQRAGGQPLEHGRHRIGLEHFRRTASDLCLVAEVDGAVAGYTVGHRWGSTAWIGPLGVTPGLMGRGIGTALMQGFCNRAADSGATVVGLETSLAVNVQIYEKQGFLARGIRLLAVKDLAAHPTAATAAFDSPAGAKAAGDLTVMPWSAVGQTKRTPLIVAARKLAGMVTAGLDHTAEFDVAQTGGMGATYVALDGQGRLAGYVVLFLRGYRCPGFGDAQPPVDPLLWISVGSAEATEALLAACESAAARAGAAHLKVPCYSGNPHSWAVLRRLGYRPEAAFVRMFWRGQYGGTADRKWGQVPIDLSSWLG